nr:hypothetical protein MF5292_00903 [Mycoplasma feriruminatoris]
MKKNLESSLKKINELLKLIKEQFDKVRAIWPEIITKNKELKTIIDEFIKITRDWLIPSELSIHYNKYIKPMMDTKNKIDEKYLEVLDIYSKLDGYAKELKNHTNNLNKAVDDALNSNNLQPIE